MHVFLTSQNTCSSLRFVLLCACSTPFEPYFGKVKPQMIPAILLCFALLSFGQGPDAQGRRQGQPPPGQQPTPTTQTTGAPTGGQTGQARPPQERPSPIAEEVAVITHHEITVDGKTLKYTATVG